VEFERKIFVKQQAAALLRSEFKKVKRGEEIAIGTATDPYQPAERRFEVTRAILEELALHSGLEIGIVTKSNLVTRDTEILRRVGEHNRVFVNVTVTTVDAELARKLEPRAPRPDLRLEAVRQLNSAGVDAGVICAPVLPEITDRPRDLDVLVKAASEAGARYIFANPLFLKPCSAAVFPAVSGRTLPRTGAALPDALCRSSISAKRIRSAAIAVDGRVAAKVRNWRPARTQQSRSAYGGRANGVVLRWLSF
jgi:DNA repair photolyase